MKKILIVNNNMHIGGVQKALISLLWNIQERYDVTLLLFSEKGECYKDIPPSVKVMTVESDYRFLGMAGKDSQSLWEDMGRRFYGAITRVFGRKYAIALMGLGQKKLSGFDVAVSYFHNAGSRSFYGGCNDFVLKHVDAPKKVAFLHCDYIHSGANTRENNRQYGRFDIIAACSQGCADAFRSVNPDLSGRVAVVSNCHRFDRIRELAQEAKQELPGDVIRIVTVARLGREKSVERAVEAIVRLGEERDKLHYYIIGDGIQRERIQQIIARKNLSRCVTLCGEMDNPYGYMRAADLLLIPSLSEAAPLVIGEAACLGTPILSMETSSAREMIEETGFGWVCENNVQAMAEALKELIAEPERIRVCRERMEKSEMNNNMAVAMFDRCVELH